MTRGVTNLPRRRTRRHRAGRVCDTPCFHHTQHQPAADIFQRKVRAMRSRVDSDDVRIRPETAFAGLGNVRAQGAKHRNDAGVTCNVENARRRIERKPIRSVAAIERSNDVPRAHIEDEELVIVLACDEVEAVARLDQQALIALRTRQVKTLDDTVRRRIDFDELASCLKDRITLRVAGLAIESDCRDTPVASDIDDRFRFSALVRYVAV